MDVALRVLEMDDKQLERIRSSLEQLRVDLNQRAADMVSGLGSKLEGWFEDGSCAVRKNVGGARVGLFFSGAGYRCETTLSCIALPPPACLHACRSSASWRRP